jgi:hypothetical protein
MAIPGCGVGHFRVRRLPSPHAAFSRPPKGIFKPRLPLKKVKTGQLNTKENKNLINKS